MWHRFEPPYSLRSFFCLLYLIEISIPDGTVGLWVKAAPLLMVFGFGVYAVEKG